MFATDSSIRFETFASKAAGSLMQMRFAQRTNSPFRLIADGQVHNVSTSPIGFATGIVMGDN